MHAMMSRTAEQVYMLLASEKAFWGRTSAPAAALPASAMGWDSSAASLVGTTAEKASCSRLWKSCTWGGSRVWVQQLAMPCMMASLSARAAFWRRRPPALHIWLLLILAV